MERLWKSVSNIYLRRVTWPKFEIGISQIYMYGEMLLHEPAL